MTNYLRSKFGRAVATAAAIGVTIISLLTLGTNKDSFLQVLGIHTAHGAPLADNSCVVSRAQNDEVYFVSCAGFF